MKQIDENEELTQDSLEQPESEQPEVTEELEQQEPDQPKEPKKAKDRTGITHRVLTIVGIVLCVILIPFLISNVVLIIQSYTNKDEVPSLFSISPMIVLTDSMKPEIDGGDLIFIKKVKPEEVKKEQIIAFFDPASKNKSVVTHRVKEIITDEEGNLTFRTKGDANNDYDDLAVSADRVIGVYTFRLRGVGKAAMFMQSTPGLILCVIVPLVLLIGYDVIRRRIYNKKKQAETDVLLAELAALKAEKEGPQTVLAEETAEVPEAQEHTEGE